MTTLTMPTMIALIETGGRCAGNPLAYAHPPRTTRGIWSRKFSDLAIPRREHNFPYARVSPVQTGKLR
jgi:hypothetical protein